MAKRVKKTNYSKPVCLRSLTDGSVNILNLLLFQQKLFGIVDKSAFSTEIHLMVNHYIALFVVLQTSLIETLQETGILGIIANYVAPVPIEYICNRSKLIVLDSYHRLHASGLRTFSALIPSFVRKRFKKGAKCKKYFVSTWQLVILLDLSLIHI